MAVLDRNAAAEEALTGCRYARHWVSKSRHGLANHAIAGTVWQALQAVGAPVWGAEAVGVAQEIQRNLGMEPMAEPFL